MAWDPKVYLKFADHRLRPAAELLARISLEAPKRVVDLGCGPGNVTALLTERWPSAKLIGVDNSQPMLDAAAKSGVAAEWVMADIDSYAPPERFDVIYSNAALHWVPNHHRLFPRLCGLLAPGGVLAVQMPHNEHRPLQRLVETMVDEKGLRSRLPVHRDLVGDPEGYFDILAPHVAAIDIWEVDYLQILTGENPAVEWAKGSSLRPVMTALEGRERESFLDEYAERLRSAYKRSADGRTLFPFRRLFILAQAAA